MDKSRTLFLVILLGAIYFSLGRILLPLFPRQHKISPFVFPQAIPLENWRLVMSQPLKSKASLLSGHHYQYQKKELRIDIQMRYMGPSVYGDISAFRQRYLSSGADISPLAIHYQKGIGYYDLSVQSNMAHLSSCINPRGISTVTARQFRQNRFTNDITFLTALQWFAGQAVIPDRRCLWTHITLPNTEKSPEMVKQTLTEAWIHWFGWWQHRFPNR